MSDDSGGDADITPTTTQQQIITADEYPMRVLAGAGTGKTFTMVRKIQRLLEKDVEPREDGVLPENILTLTFTNEAANSIQNKLVEEIGGVANDIDAYTYHAIGETILRDHAYEAGLNPNYEIATEVEQLQFAYDSLDDIPYWFTNPRVAEPGEYGDDVATKFDRFIPQMKGEGITPEDLRTYLGSPEQLIRLGEIVDRLAEEVERFDYGRWRSPSPQRLQTDMIDPLEEYKTVLERERDLLWSDGLGGDIDRYLGSLVALCDSLIELFETRQDEIVDGPLKPAFKLPALLFGAKFDGDATGLPAIDRTPLDRLREVIESCQTARDLTEGYAAYEQRLDEASMVDFSDLVTRTKRLVADADADDPLHDRWEYVFCDEFQDTDTVQFDLVTELVGDGDLFVVGDDYQAIYEWRGANVTNITERLTEALDPVDVALDSNFRSSKPILEFANRAFAHHPDYETISELEPGTDEQAVDRGVATITPPEDEENRYSVIDSDAEAELIAESIIQLLNGAEEFVSQADLDRLTDDELDGYRPEDIAILVRARHHARPLIDELETAGIPYSLGDSLAAESTGIQTVISYLKVLANPDRDDSLNRVLLLRYRLRDDDLRALNEPSEPLSETLLTAEIEEMDLSEPERVRDARADVEYLLSVRDAHSLTGLYETLKERTRIEWFLSEDDRENLGLLDEVIAEYGRERVQPELSEEFIEFLQYNATAVLDGGGVQDQPDTAEGAVNIMTVHKSKGLEFPVVIVPQLTNRAWRPRGQSNAELRHALGNKNSASPFDGRLVRRDEFEQRRAFHVAVTRAEQLCVLSGGSRGSGDEADTDELGSAVVAEFLPDELAWCLHPTSFPVWETVQDSLPASAKEWTEPLRHSIDDDRDDTVRTSKGDELTLTEAYRTVLDMTGDVLEGTATPVSPADAGLPESALTEPPIDLLPKHSYTSISTYDRCQRSHYLEYVVRAFDDPDPSLLTDEGRYTVGTTHSSTDTSQGPVMREVGTLFHDVAEWADKRSYHSATERKAAWKKKAQSILNFDHATRRKVADCIDVFFETPASDWTVTSTERRFDFIYDDEHRIVGQIDALCETPAGELVVVDYKTGRKQRSDDLTHQLPIYLYAANRRDMIGDVDKAAYVYVNDDLDVGPANRVIEQSYDETRIENEMRTIGAKIDEIKRTTYQAAETDAGTWCYDCSHRSLPCSTEFDDE